MAAKETMAAQEEEMQAKDVRYIHVYTLQYFKKATIQLVFQHV